MTDQENNTSRTMQQSIRTKIFTPNPNKKIYQGLPNPKDKPIISEESLVPEHLGPTGNTASE
jgi:hypothetical protein